MRELNKTINTELKPMKLFAIWYYSFDTHKSIHFFSISVCVSVIEIFIPD